jgi:predicted  nucleic acid-binding Zn-ribbon protein
LLEQARHVASERAELEAERSILDGVGRDLVSNEGRVEALGTEHTRLRADLTSLRARTANAEAELERRAQIQPEVDSRKQGEEAERSRLKDELEKLRPVVDVLTTEGVTEPRSRCPMTIPRLTCSPS